MNAGYDTTTSVEEGIWIETLITGSDDDATDSTSAVVTKRRDTTEDMLDNGAFTSATVNGGTTDTTNTGDDNTTIMDVTTEDKIKTIYIGHSGRSHHSRMMEHICEIGKSKGLTCAVAKKQLEKHSGHETNYKIRIKYVHSKYLARLACEALHLLRKGHQILLNGKGEFGKMSLPRIEVKEHGHSTGT